MFFLNPTILLGLFAALIPLIIHLLNFRKLRKVEFSTLSFLKELQKSKIKKIKIKQWLLLLLRTLIIIFVVLAFARPTLKGINFLSSNSTSKISSVFILDNSFSMDYLSKDGSLFNLTKKHSKNIIKQMNEEDEFIFVVSEDSVLSTFTKDNALNIIDNLTTANKTEFLEKKIKKAIEVLNKSTNANKEIYLFSDFQKSTFLDENNIDLLKEKSEENLYFYSFDIGQEIYENTNISNLKLLNSIIEKNKPLTFSAEVSNKSSVTKNNVVASLFLNDKRVAQKSINLKSNERQIINFETTLDETGLIEARVELEDDNLLNDNRAFLNFYIKGKINILIYFDDVNDIQFLESAIKAASTNNKINIEKISSNNFIKNNLSGFDAVFFASSKIPGNKIFSNYTKNGGNVVFIPPYNLTVQNYNSIKAELNLPNLKNIIKSKNEINDFTEFKEINKTHPLVKNLFANEVSTKLESPKIYNYLNYKIDSRKKSIIKLLNNITFLGEYKLGKGRIIFFNTDLTLNSSNLPIKTIFAPLISSITSYLTTSNLKKNNFLPKDKISIKIENLNNPLININLPKGNDKINVNDFSKDIVNYENTNQLGSYKFFNGNRLIKYATVNYNIKETDLEKVSPTEKEKIFTNFFGKNFVNVDIEENYIDKIKKARFGTELWKLFLIIAFLLVLIEMYVARNTRKDIGSLS